MFGFIIGTLCLFGLFATLRARRYGDVYGGWRGRLGPWDEPRERPWAQRPISPRSVLREAFVRLDTTPGQEKAIVALIEEGRDKVRSTRQELTSLRKEVAALLASELLDRAELDARLDGAQQVMARVSTTLSSTLAGVHEVLDERQRRTLSELIADGSFSRSPCFGC